MKEIFYESEGVEQNEQENREVTAETSDVNAAESQEALGLRDIMPKVDFYGKPIESFEEWKSRPRNHDHSFYGYESYLRHKGFNDVYIKNLRRHVYGETNENVDEKTNENSTEESKETDEVHGYSSDYYKNDMANAIKNGNKIAYENARNNYAKALVRETHGESEEPTAETAEEKPEDSNEAHGYSSSGYYKSEMASAIRSGNEIAYKNARKNYAKALITETLGESNEHTAELNEDKPEETNEAYGYSIDYYKTHTERYMAEKYGRDTVEKPQTHRTYLPFPIFIPVPKTHGESEEPETE